MHHLRIDRRHFLKGCCATAAAGAVGPTMFFADEAQAAVNAYDTVVHIFLRGGIDGLNLVPPISGNDRAFYEEARPNLRIDASGTYGALPLTLANGTEVVVRGDGSQAVQIGALLDLSAPAQAFHLFDAQGQALPRLAPGNLVSTQRAAAGRPQVVDGPAVRAAA